MALGAILTFTGVRKQWYVKRIGYSRGMAYANIK